MKWCVYSVCDVPLGVGKIVRESEVAAEISYDDDWGWSEVYGKGGYESFDTVVEAIRSFAEKSGEDVLEVTRAASLAFSDERDNLSILLG